MFDNEFYEKPETVVTDYLSSGSTVVPKRAQGRSDRRSMQSAARNYERECAKISDAQQKLAERNKQRDEFNKLRSSLGWN